MKPIHYNVPVPKDRTLFVQEDILERFYPHMHRHEEYQLIWIVEGTGQLMVDDSLHNFRKDDIFLLGSNQPHVFKNEQVGGLVRSVSVFFNVKGRLAGMLDLPELGVLLDFISNSQRGFRVPNTYLSQVRRRIEILKKSDHMDQLINFFYLLKALNSVSAHLKPLSGASFSENEPHATIRINKLCRYIDEHFKDNIALSEVAEQAHLTPQAFCRFFKKSTGKTFVSYLNDIRVREACRLLGTGTHDCISTVAYLCGFNSITNFNRVFRNVIGESPKEYINKYITLLYQ
ncbi:AraC family transcriptional regulator [Sphingobacterium pedocola]|uniref:AraC family transcriptional regulator n=1 Tax=Sphingobacterium pedocola TaxID=2082722 RepID=A0ABR9TAM5_9SPHI|nr:AraC family transcriptional regulator [Sphingobacterium pedocola]MBE8722415.1 AraC family transcriptional regulator [Sphingobacterium pedocola]